MRRTAIVVVVACVCLVLGPMACSALVDTSGYAGPSSSGDDAGIEAASDVDVNLAVDASSDACTTSNIDVNLSDESRWTLRGSAEREGTTVILTPEREEVAGAVWLKDRITLGTLDVQASFKVDSATAENAADGLAFAIVKGGMEVPPIGGRGSGVGLQGLNGMGVVIDVIKDTFDPIDAPFVGLVNTMAPFVSWYRKSTPINRMITDGIEHTLRVFVERGQVRVHVDGNLLIDAEPLQGGIQSGDDVYLGFAAATGSLDAKFTVTRATVTISPCAAQP